MRRQRYPEIGETLTLTKDPQNYVFFHSKREPTVDLCISIGCVFEFNEPLEYKDDESTRKTTGRRAQLQQEGEFAVLVFTDSAERIRLEDIKAHQGLRTKVVAHS